MTHLLPLRLRCHGSLALADAVTTLACWLFADTCMLTLGRCLGWREVACVARTLESGLAVDWIRLDSTRRQRRCVRPIDRFKTHRPIQDPSDRFKTDRFKTDTALHIAGRLSPIPTSLAPADDEVANSALEKHANALLFSALACALLCLHVVHSATLVPTLRRCSVAESDSIVHRPCDTEREWVSLLSVPPLAVCAPPLAPRLLAGKSGAI